jgi:hypothetical protein
MSPKKQKSASLSQTFREFLRTLALSMINAKFKDSSMAEAKKDLLKGLDISASALEAMLYRGSGGMDAWVELFGALTEMNPEQLDLALTEIQDTLKKKRKLSKGDAAWIKRGESLPEDKKLFWTDLIAVMEELEDGPYTIQRRK